MSIINSLHVNHQFTPCQSSIHLSQLLKRTHLYQHLPSFVPNLVSIVQIHLFEQKLIPHSLIMLPAKFLTFDDIFVNSFYRKPICQSI